VRVLLCWPRSGSLLAAIRNPAQGQARGFLWFYFVNEHIMRFLNKRVPPGYDTVPLFLFWALLVLWLIPWRVSAAARTRGSVARACIDGSPARAESSFRSVGVGDSAGFFSFSTRRSNYTIPALPASRCGGGWWRAEAACGRRPTRYIALGGILRSCSCVECQSAAIGWRCGQVHPPPAGVDLAELLEEKSPGL